MPAACAYALHWIAQTGWLDSDVDEGGGRLHDAAGFDRPQLLRERFEVVFPAPKGDGTVPFRIDLGPAKQGCYEVPLREPRPPASRRDNRGAPVLFRTRDDRLWFAYVERQVPCSYA